MQIRSFCAALALACAIAAPALAQQPEPQAKADGRVSQITQEVSQEIYSPFCPGKTLAMCPSPAAADVRRDIQDMAAEGLNKKQIKERVIAEYGEEFRLEEPPISDDIGLLVLIAVGLLGAGGAVFVFSRRNPDKPPARAKSPGSEPSKDAGESEDPYLDELRSQYRD